MSALVSSLIKNSGAALGKLETMKKSVESGLSQAQQMADTVSSVVPLAQLSPSAAPAAPPTVATTASTAAQPVAPPPPPEKSSSPSIFSFGATEADIQPSAEDKKDQILKAYYDIIISQKEIIAKKFQESLDSYIKDHFSVENDKLKNFIQDVVFSQMNTYFKSINTSYLQHAFLLQIFHKHKDLLLNVFREAVMSASVLSTDPIETNVSNIFIKFEKLLIEMNQQNKLIRGGGLIQGGLSRGGNTDNSKMISEIANWFPLNETIQEVNRDIAYIIENVFIETMNRENTLSTTVSAMLSKYFHLIPDAMAKIIRDQPIDVDIAILHASIVESKGDARDTILQAIESTLRENPKFVSSQDKDSSAISQIIYDKIISISQNKYNTDIAKNIPNKSIGGSNIKNKNNATTSRRNKTASRRKRRKTARAYKKMHK